MTPWSLAINAAVGAVAVATVVLGVIALLAYRRTRRGRFLLVAAAFLLLLARQVGLIAGLLASQPLETLLAVATLGDACLVFLLYLAVVR